MSVKMSAYDWLDSRIVRCDGGRGQLSVWEDLWKLFQLASAGGMLLKAQAAVLTGQPADTCCDSTVEDLCGAPSPQTQDNFVEGTAVYSLNGRSTS